MDFFDDLLQVEVVASFGGKLSAYVKHARHSNLKRARKKQKQNRG